MWKLVWVILQFSATETKVLGVGGPIISHSSRTSGRPTHLESLCLLSPQKTLKLGVYRHCITLCVSVWLLAGAVVPACSGKFGPGSRWGSLQDWMHQSGDCLQVSYTSVCPYHCWSLRYIFTTAWSRTCDFDVTSLLGFDWIATNMLREHCVEIGFLCNVTPPRVSGAIPMS